VHVPQLQALFISSIKLQGLFSVCTNTGATVGITTGLFWLFSALAGQATPLIIHIQGFFYIMSGVLLVGFFTVLIFLPETKVSR
jgi:hypothetical protein